MRGEGCRLSRKVAGRREHVFKYKKAAVCKANARHQPICMAA